MIGERFQTNLGVVCDRINEGGSLLEDVWRKKIFLQEIPAHYACIACSIFLGSIYTHTCRLVLSDLDIFIIYLKHHFAIFPVS